MTSPIILPTRERMVAEEMRLLDEYARQHPLLVHHAAVLSLAADAWVQVRGAGGYDVEAWADLWRLYYDRAGRCWKQDAGYTPLAEARKLLAVDRAVSERERAKAQAAPSPRRADRATREAALWRKLLGPGVVGLLALTPRLLGGG